MSYIPQPGTVPHRVINWLKLQPVGANFTTAVISEELGIEKSHVGPCLNAPVKHGAITVRKEKGLSFYGLGNGVPVVMPHDNELDEPLIPERDIVIARQVKAKEVAPLIKAMKMAIPVYLPKPDTQKANSVPTQEETKAAVPAPYFRVGEFSDGTFVLERGPWEKFELKKSEFSVLLDFMERRTGAAA
jgi:hypothetical protein